MLGLFSEQGMGTPVAALRGPQAEGGGDSRACVALQKSCFFISDQITSPVSAFHALDSCIMNNWGSPNHWMLTMAAPLVQAHQLEVMLHMQSHTIPS
jgi:hypothetical protein